MSGGNGFWDLVAGANAARPDADMQGRIHPEQYELPKSEQRKKAVESFGDVDAISEPAGLSDPQRSQWSPGAAGGDNREVRAPRYGGQVDLPAPQARRSGASKIGWLIAVVEAIALVALLFFGRAPISGNDGGAGDSANSGPVPEASGEPSAGSSGEGEASPETGNASIAQHDTMADGADDNADNGGGGGGYNKDSVQDARQTTHAPVSNGTVTVYPVGTQIFTGNAVEPKPLVYDQQERRELIEGLDYDLEYNNNVYPGVATVAVIGKGDYDGANVEASFAIRPDSRNGDPEGSQGEGASNPADQSIMGQNAADRDSEGRDEGWGAQGRDVSSNGDDWYSAQADDPVDSETDNDAEIGGQ